MNKCFQNFQVDTQKRGCWDMLTLLLIFCGDTVLLSIVAVPACIPTSSTRGPFFSTTALTIVTSCLVANSHSNSVMWYLVVVSLR